MSTNIFSLSSGITATDEVQKDLLDAKNVGQSCLQRFVKDRIESDDVGFYNVLKKNKLRTFDVKKKTSTMKVNGQKIAIRADRETFARLLSIQQKRNVDLREVMRYELCVLPLSLANYDGTLRKTQKSKLFKHLESVIPETEEIQTDCPNIFDGMVLLQKLPPTLATFGNLSDYLLKKILSGGSRVAFFVTDFYLENSVKSMERDRRAATGSLRGTKTVFKISAKF